MYSCIKKILFKFDPENVHNFVERGLHFSGEYFPFVLNLFKKPFNIEDEKLSQNILGITFKNPVGLGAGFDKNASMLNGLATFGFGHIEYGTITPRPQPGNPKPRIKRYPKLNSIQNAMGFNNAGMGNVKDNLKPNFPFKIPLGASIGKNKITPNDKAIEDYKTLLEGLKFYCDYFAINVSSPNTVGLRDLQNEEFINELFTEAKKITDKPILLKLSPDMPIDAALSLCKCAIDAGASGIIATNTTQDYSLIEGAKENGGLSGDVLKEKSYEFFKAIAKEFHDKTTLIAVGGIDSGLEAYRRMELGASLVQIYSAFIFKGPALIKKINEEILLFMQKDGFENISEVVGSAWKKEK